MTYINTFRISMLFMSLMTSVAFGYSVKETHELNDRIPNFLYRHLLEEVKTYPNPVLDKLIIDLTTVEYPTVKVTIFNAIQLVITSFDTNPQLIELNLITYKPGIYYIRFQYQNDVLIRKFVRK